MCHCCQFCPWQGNWHARIWSIASHWMTGYVVQTMEDCWFCPVSRETPHVLYRARLGDIRTHIQACIIYVWCMYMCEYVVCHLCLRIILHALTNVTCHVICVMFYLCKPENTPTWRATTSLQTSLACLVHASKTMHKRLSMHSCEGKFCKKDISCKDKGLQQCRLQN